jgi:WD40-like Beta Propeller Repeat
MSLLRRALQFRSSLATGVFLVAAATGLGVVVASESVPTESAYLGESLPGFEPRLFAPGIVNTGLTTRDVAITPDGREIYFCQVAAGFSHAVICVTRWDGERWTEPEVAPFSGSSKWVDLEPAISPDGEQFFFYSTRPISEGSEGDQDLWVMDRIEDGWGTARPVGAPVNSADPEFFPSVTDEGSLLFSRADPATRIHSVYLSRLVDGVYQEPELLPEAVNAGRNRFNACITPAGDRIITPVAGHPDNHGGVDYWLSYRDGAGAWAGPVNLGTGVNDGGGRAWSPYVSPDGRFFFFMSSRTVGGDPEWPQDWSSLQARHQSGGQGRPGIFWMRADFLDSLVTGGPNPASNGEEASSLAAAAITPAPKFPRLSGAYLGQKPPGLQPELFAPGLVSTGLTERDILFSPDGRSLLFGVMDLGLVTVMESRIEGGVWTEPTCAPFHADPEFACFEPTYSADGLTVIFLANRAAPGQEQGAGWANQNLFRSRFDGAEWSEASALPAPVTTDAAEYFPSLASDGTLYFSREDPERHPFLWSAEADGDRYAEPQRLPDTVNVGTSTYNAFVAPDESFLIACVAGHESNLGPSDYWISFKDGAGQWRPAVNMGERFNGPEWRAASASLSADGNVLFFSTTRPDPTLDPAPDRWTRKGLLGRHVLPGTGSSDIWWVDADILNEYR